ncbi:Hypothetical_protein [Hexamita inflata]|uniref:Hypothetical_protein n=1 Tax=Hexamita inflata TaxID=28002 RepID=A0AA86QYN2_9EUKA|nr:Hypothetical protein HINF_LOCUS49779 [Hexamita inflata]
MMVNCSMCVEAHVIQIALSYACGGFRMLSEDYFLKFTINSLQQSGAIQLQLFQLENNLCMFLDQSFYIFFFVKLLHNLALKGNAIFNPLISEMYPKILLYLKGLWSKNRTKTHDIWHSLTRGLDMKEPPCKRKCDPF